MRNKRLLIVLAGATVFGLIAAVSVSRLLSNAQARGGGANRVVVASVDVPLGTRIIAEHLTTVTMPQNATPAGTFDAPDKLIGRVAVTNIAAREPVTDFKLAPEGSAGGLSAVIPEGYRAMTVKVDDVVGLSGFVMPGALVDVVVVIDPESSAGGRNPISKIVLQNIKVLASGSSIDQPKQEREREPESVKTVTLQVTPEQAEKLALASTEGKLRLVMRNATDQGDAPTEGVDKRRLLSGESATPVPAPGSLQSEQPQPPASSQRQFRAPRFQAPRETSRSVAPTTTSGNNAAASPAPAAPRASVEMIEGAKRRNVDLP
ncbi:MAG: Flp pilus assembly protein CpaB [Pyrinomonadaceae bacterium]